MGIDVAALVHQSKLGVKTTHEHHETNNSTLAITRVASWCRLLFTPISPTFPFALSRLIRRYQPDILHLHLPNPSTFWLLLLPSARRLPWVVHWQSDVLTTKSSAVLRICYGCYRIFERWLLRRANKIIVTSSQYLDSSPAIAPFREKCCTIPLGVIDRFATARSETIKPSSDGPLQILAIGRLTHYKGFDVLLRAIAETDNTELDLVGTGEQFMNLTSLAQKLGIAERVRFHGRLSDQDRDSLLQICDCLCLPSIDRTESFGVVLLEAMSAGKPCVISEVPGSGMTSLVEAGNTGIVV
ncbi:MAG: glycosyltransferase, partial [Betaproteobacteria bacterium]